MYESVGLFLLLKSPVSFLRKFALTGPNELSILDVNAIPSILGQDGMPKGPSMSPLHDLDQQIH